MLRRITKTIEIIISSIGEEGEEEQTQESGQAAKQLRMRAQNKTLVQALPRKEEQGRAL